MLAFTETTIPAISASLDFFNIMTYDLMNRRDKVTKHHTGIELSLDAINTYEERGVPSEKMNLGFAFYIKWYKTDPHGGCDLNPIGCKTTLMEDPLTGADLGQAGAFSWHDPVPSELSASYEKAMAHGKYDSEHGGHYYWDSDEDIWWSWDTPEAIAKKFPAIVEQKILGGAFAWGLGEDADGFTHLKALTTEMKKFETGYQGEGSNDTSALSSSLQRKDEL
jgi:GH18 family chitinase